jgi:hypothetical protein
VSDDEISVSIFQLPGFVHWSQLSPSNSQHGSNEVPHVRPLAASTGTEHSWGLVDTRHHVVVTACRYGDWERALDHASTHSRSLLLASLFTAAILVFLDSV